MKTYEFYKSIKLSWSEVGDILAEYIGSIFRRELKGIAKGDDYCYWDFSSKNHAFSISEIYTMIHHVNGGADMCEDSIPIEDNASHSIGHILSYTLLQKALGMTWEAESITENVLWLMNIHMEDDHE